MVVGVLELSLAVPAFTLKEKRSVVRRILARTRSSFNVAAAEVDALDVPDGAVIGIVGVSGDKRYLEGLLQKVEDFVDNLHLAEIVNAERTFEHY